jgi:hypothetical protein
VYFALPDHNASSPITLYIDWRCPFFVSFFGQAKKENKSAPQAKRNTAR